MQRSPSRQGSLRSLPARRPPTLALTVRPPRGGRIGCVGLPHDVTNIPAGDIFWKNITIGGGIAPTTSYTAELLTDVLSGKLDPTPVFDLTLSLSELAKGYEAMDKREAIKVLIKPLQAKES